MRWPAAIEIILFLAAFCSLVFVADGWRECKMAAFSNVSLSFLGESVLLVMGLAAATIAYGAFRRSMGYMVCRACGSREIIPGDSPVVLKMEATH
jgi:hypothetical protein